MLSLDDAIEKHREIALEIITTVVGRVGFKEEAMILLPAIAKRMNKLPFAEPCKFA